MPTSTKNLTGIEMYVTIHKFAKTISDYFVLQIVGIFYYGGYNDEEEFKNPNKDCG